MTRAQYEDMESLSKKLKPANPLEYENERLKSALFELTSHRCNMRPLLAFLEEDVIDNQKCVVAIYRAAMDIKVSTSPRHANFVISVMQWAARNDLVARFPAESALCRDHFDQALTRSYIFMKKNDVGLCDWWDVHKQVAHLVLKVADFEICMACKSNWLDAQASLDAVVCQSSIGRTVFGSAHISLKHARVHSVIDRLLLEMRESKELDLQAMR